MNFSILISLPYERHIYIYIYIYILYTYTYIYISKFINKRAPSVVSAEGLRRARTFVRVWASVGIILSLIIIWVIKCNNNSRLSYHVPCYIHHWAVMFIPIPLPRQVIQTSYCTHLLFNNVLELAWTWAWVWMAQLNQTYSISYRIT